MASCSLWAQSYSYPECNRFVIEADDIPKIVVSFNTTAEEGTLKANLYAELDKVYKECMTNDWAAEKKVISKSIDLDSYLQAKRFINYIPEIPSPAVIPYYTGKLGLEWNIENKILIAIVFNTDNTFMYSIITDEEQDCGQKLQTHDIQREFSDNLVRIFKRCH